MTLEEAVIQALRDLPVDKQQEVLDFAQFLKQKRSLTSSRRSLKGLWTDLDLTITENDIAEVRQEMWGNFPREIDL